jgi:alpha-D-ribose 1-methylphosphonate 5-triphosphate synthase subunit PhnI
MLIQLSNKLGSLAPRLNTEALLLDRELAALVVSQEQAQARVVGAAEAAPAAAIAVEAETVSKLVMTKGKLIVEVAKVVKGVSGTKIFKEFKEDSCTASSSFRFD